MTRKEYDEAINVAFDEAAGCPEWNAIFELSLLKQGLKIVTDVDFKNTNNNDMSPRPVKELYYTYPYPSFIVEA